MNNIMSKYSSRIKDIAHMIDHTLLKANASDEQIKRLCEEAIKYGFYSVCVNPSKVAIASKFLIDKDVHVCAVIGFPLGASTKLVKAFEIKDAVANGADEIDVVVNIGAIKSGNWDEVDSDIKLVIDSVESGIVVKLILETCMLTDTEKIKVCQIAKNRRADFVKTSTGFGSYGATVEDVRLLRSVVDENMGVKASGGIKNVHDTIEMINAGATRIGTSSGIAIIKELEQIDFIYK